MREKWFVRRGALKIRNPNYFYFYYNSRLRRDDFSSLSSKVSAQNIFYFDFFFIEGSNVRMKKRKKIASFYVILLEINPRGCARTSRSVTAPDLAQLQMISLHNVPARCFHCLLTYIGTCFCFGSIFGLCFDISCSCLIKLFPAFSSFFGKICRYID